jgi:hypothetical protein
VKLTRSRKQYGATQWTSPSIGLHLKLGDMQVVSAYTPAHTHPETLAYCIEVEDDTLTASLADGWRASKRQGARVLDADDTPAIRALHDEIEAGARWRIVRAERQKSGAQRVHLDPCT